MDLIQFDSTPIEGEFGQFFEAIYFKEEQEIPVSNMPNVFIDITGKDPIIIKTDPDANNLIANQRVAFENVPKKISETLRKPMKPLIHRCVGRIFSPIDHRRNQLVQQAEQLLQQLNDNSEETQSAIEREAENIGSVGQDKENECLTIIESTQSHNPALNSNIMTNQDPLFNVAEPDLPLVQPKAQYYCSLCQKSFSRKSGLTHHIKKTKIHAENLRKSQMVPAPECRLN